MINYSCIITYIIRLNGKIKRYIARRDYENPKKSPNFMPTFSTFDFIAYCVWRGRKYTRFPKSKY